MAPREKSQLKRGRVSPTTSEALKKPRRSERLSRDSNGDAPEHLKTPVTKNQQKLPSPVTHLTEDDSNELYKESTATPPAGRPSQIAHRTPEDTISSQGQGLSSPPQDTQAFPSQYVDPNAALSDEVEDEVKEGVWGYLFPLDTKYGRCVVLKRRHTCPLPDAVSGSATVKQKKKGRALEQEESFEESKIKGIPSGGYLIGRHPECDVVIDDPVISNRHCILFIENKGQDTVAILEDLSSNGTFVNEAMVGRNQRRELREQDEIAVMDKARFIFRYPRSRTSSAFLQQYTLLERLGKGHFAEVFLCVEKATGSRYAVKIFTKHPGMEEKSKTDGLQQEIAVLMGVSHPNVLCLKDTFNEKNAVYLVLELAPEGELFNHIVMKQKLTEEESRTLFIQLFQGIKYLHDRNIVHRDIKPENILVVDKEIHVKLADFGLAKIIGEESFTTTLCGTPSYVAPEILAEGRHRKYTKAVDVWSLGVVLYICLCGFPPFSDELYSRDFPYTLSQQIKSGRFDYPSPYWDSVGDPALDLIDSMLVVDPEKRFAIDQCLEHPWITQKLPGVNDSTDGLVAGIGGLDVHRRGITRERTLLSSVNEVHLARQLPLGPQQDGKGPLKVYAKNPSVESGTNVTRIEARPADQRDAREFMEMGGKGDQELFGNDGSSFYSKAEAAAAKGKAKVKTKGKTSGK
ncbi:kinase-like domain-containing protein [Pseudomassariella vexata]|uniref:Kinase-like domain-containing protein n=1 Tax=Pseudomassariella vexata TaxID=1141098 RepID=A0A1Y2E311_9PEZI|nr:kinase-like domain-containing protein [Pseudomassariella vexata]ORY65922.1 kinase-like domain-containing protein [Pseudomassariella vexata]